MKTLSVKDSVGDLHTFVADDLDAVRDGDLLRVVEFLDEGREEREMAVFVAPVMWLGGSWPASCHPLIHVTTHMPGIP